MGFYLRKSISVGPLRFNLSKSGIGVSAGVKGLRIGVGPRGNYVHMGRGGLYYRATLPPSSPPRNPHIQPDQRATPQISPDTHAPLAEIESADVSQIVDSSSRELLDELNRKRAKMTAFVFNLAPQQVLIAMDTLAITGESKEPFFYTTKFYPLPHLQGVMFATGIGDLATKWFVRLERYVARDIKHLDEFVQPGLQELGREFGLSATNTTTVYHVGWSELEQRYVAFAYRSTNNFASEPLDYGLRTKPGLPGAVVNQFPQDFIKIIDELRVKDNALPIKDRVVIGGEVQTLLMQDKAMTITTSHRFEDYEFMYEQMCRSL